MDYDRKICKYILCKQMVEKITKININSIFTRNPYLFNPSTEQAKKISTIINSVYNYDIIATSNNTDYFLYYDGNIR